MLEPSRREHSGRMMHAASTLYLVHSGQILVYIGLLACCYLSGWRDSDPRPFGPQPNALPSCATPRKYKI